MTYLINYAIAPYSMKIFDELLNYCSISFDKSLNETPKPVRWVCMFVIGVNLKRNYVYVT